jgi:hypothetical protein
LFFLFLGMPRATSSKRHVTICRFSTRIHLPTTGSCRSCAVDIPSRLK